MNASTMKSNCDGIADQIFIHFKKCASVAAKEIREGLSPIYVEPAEPKIEAGKTIGLVEKSKLDRVLHKYFEDAGVCTDLNARMYNLLLSHCDVSMREIMRGLEGWDAVSLTQEGMRYHELIEEVYHVQDSTRQGMAEAADLDAKLYNTYQYNNQSVTDYIDKYLSFVDSVHIYGGFSGAYTPRIPCVREVRQMRRCQRLRHNKQRDSSTAIHHCPPLPRVEQTEI